MSNSEILDKLCRDFKRLNLNESKQDEIDRKWKRLSEVSTIENIKRQKLGLNARSVRSN